MPSTMLTGVVFGLMVEMHHMHACMHACHLLPYQCTVHMMAMSQSSSLALQLLVCRILQAGVRGGDREVRAAGGPGARLGGQRAAAAPHR